jgi:PAS domain S-box-containing protein
VGGHGIEVGTARDSDPSSERRADDVQAALYRIAELASSAQDMQEFYRAVHAVVGALMYANNIFIALYDEVRQLINWPYYVDEVDLDLPDPNQWDAFGIGNARGTTAYVLRTGEPQLIPYERLSQLIEAGEIELVGRAGEDSSWVGVPLKAEGRTVGVLAVQSYTKDVQYSQQDKELLAFVGQHIGAALSRARAIEETRQRNAELALINSVQEALAGELELQAIYEVVGEKLRDVFDAQVIDIGIYDEATELIHFPYTIERGVRYPDEPTPLSELGFRRHVMQTREPLLIDEDVVGAGEVYGNRVLGSGEMPKSVLYVPLVAGGKARGAVSLQNFDRERAFTHADVQLLETLTRSLSVALENARLVHETRQRNAELAVINSVQESIAGELDPQAIYDLVGDKLQEVFDAQVVSISMYDQATRLLDFPYVIERGERMHLEPIPLIGFRKHVLETREPLMINEDVPAAAERYGNPLVLSGEPVKSSVFVPLLVGGHAVGVVSLQNLDRENAFTEGDLSVLTTVSGSVSVALENARLVEETRQRVAELATVNSVGQALASQLELDALIELVGERVRETFEADIAYVALHDESAGRIDFPYYYEAGERGPQDPMPYGEGLTSQILDSREPLLLNREAHYEGRPTVGTPSRSYLGVPILVGEKAIGAMSVQSTREAGRFGEPDARLLATIASNVGVAIQNARLFAETRRQKQYFESLGEISPVAVVVMDPDERVTGWNPAATELFGHSAREALGRQIDDLVFGDDVSDEGREITREALASGRAQRIARRRRKDGAPIDVDLMLVPLTVDDERLGFLAVYHDITELQTAREEAEAATQAKSAFLATMSHEIRTPMNAVIGMTDLLLGTELTGEQREFAQIVRTSGDALLHVIDDILDYSKIEAGKLELEREPFDLRDCIEGALDLVTPRAWEKEIELGCLIDEDAPAGVLGDEARLRQVLLNLLSNAVKFTEKGEVVVLVEAEPTGSGSYRLELAVRDTGIGIPRERMDKLFTSFSQVDASTTRRYGGTGLGLAISKRLVDLMGGTIVVESEEGRGSTFRIALPVDAAHVPARISLDDALPRLAGKRILVVDDNATNREIVSRHARSWGMEPVAAELPSAALELIAGGEHFDVAVLDMMMPDMDGIVLAREIRRHRDERELPLLLLTSLGRLPQAPSTGEFSAQLAKPIKASQLYNALVQLLTAADEGEAVQVATDRTAVSTPLRILLAEDNAMNQMVALRLLERLGYGADVAWNGLEALEALDRKPYDVVLMDVQMPELDGLDASRRICERWPADTRPRIIAMTANAMPEDREACLAAGMDDYVAKPVRADELAKALKRAKPVRREVDVSSQEVRISFDSAAHESLRELGGDDFLAEVVDAFLADAPGLVATLRRALRENDTDELRRAAHTLKSNGSTLGAERFSELCRELEQNAKSGRLESASELVDRIEDEYRALAEALAALGSEPAA